MLEKLVDFPGASQPAFVDRDPEIFRILLGIARGWPLSILDTLPAFQRQAAWIDADYFQMTRFATSLNFTFRLAQSNDHAFISNAGTTYTVGKVSQENCILGTKEIPGQGRTYWEVTIVERPDNQPDSIGVAEPSVDPSSDLDCRGAWTWRSGSNNSYINIESDNKHAGVLPLFEKGMVIGIDVNMDRGSLSFWQDGAFLAQALVNLKGKTLFPAFSVRSTTVMHVRTGLAAPELMELPNRV